MYRRPLLPHDLRPPESWAGPGFTARPLRLTDARDDLAAVPASATRLRGAMDPADPWPEGLALHENRVDLGCPEREFTAGHSCTWSLRDPDDRRCLGCACLYPADRAGADAMAFWSVRMGHTERDPAVGAAFRALIAALPLTCALPGRDAPWPIWRARPPRT